ncbi:MAG: VOC family protein [Nitrospinaceae bacterium]|nr:VOC family protein [Nitrospinaceae bacterium]
MFRHDHLHHLSADPGAAVEWYKHVFDAKELERHDIRGGEAVRLDIGGVNIMVQQKQPDAEGAPAPASPYHGLDHFCFRVDDIEAVGNLLKERGANIYDGPRSPRPGYGVIHLSGPDGVHVELIMRPEV